MFNLHWNLFTGEVRDGDTAEPYPLNRLLEEPHYLAGAEAVGELLGRVVRRDKFYAVDELVQFL